MDEKLTNNSGVNHYPSQVVAWVTDEVLDLPIVARWFGRKAVKSHYNFRSGMNAKTPNLQIYPRAMNQHAFIRETGLIAYLFRQFFLLKPHTIAFQMELIAREFKGEELKNLLSTIVLGGFINVFVYLGINNVRCFQAIHLLEELER